MSFRTVSLLALACASAMGVTSVGPPARGATVTPYPFSVRLPDGATAARRSFGAHLRKTGVEEELPADDDKLTDASGEDVEDRSAPTSDDGAGPAAKIPTLDLQRVLDALQVQGRNLLEDEDHEQLQRRLLEERLKSCHARRSDSEIAEDCAGMEGQSDVVDITWQKYSTPRTSSEQDDGEPPQDLEGWEWKGDGQADINLHLLRQKAQARPLDNPPEGESFVESIQTFISNCSLLTACAGKRTKNITATEARAFLSSVDHQKEAREQILVRLRGLGGHEFGERIEESEGVFGSLECACAEREGSGKLQFRQLRIRY